VPISGLDQRFQPAGLDLSIVMKQHEVFAPREVSPAIAGASQAQVNWRGNNLKAGYEFRQLRCAIGAGFIQDGDCLIGNLIRSEKRQGLQAGTKKVGCRSGWYNY
jgi:hypothetical protein